MKKLYMYNNQYIEVRTTIHFPIFRWLKWRERYKKARRLKRRKRAAPVEDVLSPRMSEHNSEPIYEDITAVDRLADTDIYQHLVELSPVDLPPPVPALYSNMTFSTISQDTQSLPDTVVEGEGSEAPTNIIPPYISRYDSLVTWLKNMSTGVQE